LQDFEIFDTIKGLNPTEDFAKAKRKLEMAVNDSAAGYTTEQKQLAKDLAKNEQRYKNAAETKRSLVVKNLIEMFKSGLPNTTDEFLKDTAKQNKITLEDMQIVLKTVGGASGSSAEDVQLFQKSQILPTSSSMAEIDRGIASLKRLSADKVAQFPKLTDVNNVYDVLACVCGNNADFYRKQSNATVMPYIEKFNQENAQAGSESAVGLAVSILEFAKTNIFANEEQRQKYNNYVIYTTPTVQGEIKKITAIVGEYHDEVSATRHIAQLDKAFGNYNIAVSIFNAEAKRMDNPIIPPKNIQNPIDMSAIIDELKSSLLDELKHEQEQKAPENNITVIKPQKKLIYDPKCPYCGNIDYLLDTAFDDIVWHEKVNMIYMDALGYTNCIHCKRRLSISQFGQLGLSEDFKDTPTVVHIRVSIGKADPTTDTEIENEDTEDTLAEKIKKFFWKCSGYFQIVSTLAAIIFLIVYFLQYPLESVTLFVLGTRIAFFIGGPLILFLLIRLLESNIKRDIILLIISTVSSYIVAILITEDFTNESELYEISFEIFLRLYNALNIYPFYTISLSVWALFGLLTIHFTFLSKVLDEISYLGILIYIAAILLSIGIIGIIVN